MTSVTAEWHWLEEPKADARGAAGCPQGRDGQEARAHPGQDREHASVEELDHDPLAGSSQRPGRNEVNLGMDAWRTASSQESPEEDLGEFAALFCARRGMQQHSSFSAAAAAGRSDGLSSHEASPPDEDAPHRLHGAPSPNAEVGLRVGATARIQGLQTKPELNGQQVKLCEFDAVKLRWRVLFGCDSQKMLRPENLEPVPPADPPSLHSAPSSVEPTLNAEEFKSPKAEEGSKAEEGKNSSTDQQVDLERYRVWRGADELLELLAQRRQALKRAQLTTSAGIEQTSMLQQELEAAVTHFQPSLEEYMKLKKPPANLVELRHRNQARGQLQSLAQTVKRTLEGMVGVFQEPSEVLDAVEHSTMQRLDHLQTCFQQLREEIAEGFRLQGEEVRAAKERRDAILAAVSPHVTTVDQFLRCLAEELDTESSARREVNAWCMAKLREEEERFVRANHSPSHNPAFKKVRAEIDALEATERTCEERDAADVALIRGWDQLLGDMPNSSAAEEDVAATSQEAAPSAMPEAEEQSGEDGAPQSEARRSFWRLW